ncbi:MAG: helix-turn-helix transcriptional regulator [Rickettsia sp.]|jgi:transcriptional regulator with XRE-family HTH domain|nr:helix-turn-helix transcriptional regulator [Rickettsia sp.]
MFYRNLLHINVSENIKNFLKTKLKNNNLKRKDFVQASGIPSSTLGNINKAGYSSPTLNTIITIANYFECSMDEVVGRNIHSSLNLRNCKFLISDSESISINLKNFLTEKLKTLNLNSYKLARDLGFNELTITSFIKENSSQKILGSAVTIALADYFQVSLDEMVGRIKPTTSDNNEPSQQNSNSDTEVK